MSRPERPKQFLPLTSNLSMLQETVLRVTDPKRFGPITVVGNQNHLQIFVEEFRRIDIDPGDIVLEPVARNTAPAAAVAALLRLEQEPDAAILLLPSDHHIGDVPAFLAAVDRAVPAAREGALVLFGIEPKGPETGFGYIKRGEPVDDADDCFRVDKFVEKPDEATAETMLRCGDYQWNSGMFLFQANRLLAELERFAPDVVLASRKAVETARTEVPFTYLGSAFSENPNISIDHAVMEKTGSAVMVNADMDWRDVGSWDSLRTLGRTGKVH